MKKIISNKIIVSLICCVLAVAARASDFGCNLGGTTKWYFNIISESAKTCELKTIGNKTYSGYVTIPEYVVVESATNTSLIGKTYYVTRIASGVFEGSNITGITIPYTVTYVGANVCKNCKNLKKAQISAPLLHNSFEGCTKLATVEFSGVTNIPSSCFSGCTSLTSVTCPSVSSDAFKGCTSLTNIQVNGSVGPSAFEGCTKLQSVILRNPIQIETKAFMNCNALSDIQISGSRLTSIGSSAFSNCKAISNFDCPTSVKEIGESAFEACTSLSNLSLNPNLSSVGANAFDGCVGLETVRFSGDFFAWQKIDFANDKSNPLYYGAEFIPAQNTLFFEYPETGTLAANYFNGCPDLYSVVIPANVKSISSGAFKNCPNLKKVFFLGNTPPTGIDEAFDPVEDRITYVSNNLYNAYASTLGGTVEIQNTLSSWTEKNGVKFIVNAGARTAEVVDCDYTTADICIPNQITNINPYTGATATLKVSAVRKNAFYGHINMTNFSLDNEVPVIEDNAFTKCYALNKITFEEGATPLALGSDGNQGLFKDCKTLETVNIFRPISYDKTSAKGYSPFYGNRSISVANVGGYESTLYKNEFGETPIKTLNITGSVEKIENEACKGLSLTSLSIDANNTQIGESAFENCGSLATLSFGRGIADIGNSAFKNCTSLTSAVIINPNNPSTIGNSAFYGCQSMRGVTIGEKVTNVSDYAFYSCSGVSSITLRNGISSIGNHAFENCSGVSSVSFGTGLKTIGAYAFNGCSILSAIILKDGVSSIGESAFKGCSSATQISVGNGTSMTIGNSSFENCSKAAIIKLGTGIASIGEASFMKCSAVDQINLCDEITEIGKTAFAGCSTLKSINFPSSLKLLNDSVCADCSNLKTVTMGNQVTFVGNYSFRNNVALSSITFSNAVTTIGARAFEQTTALKNINLPESLSTIGAYAFNFSGLESVIIPSGVTQLKEGTFMSSGLKTIETTNVATIDKLCFANSALSSIAIKPAVKTINDAAFNGCSNLEVLNIVESSVPLTLGKNADNQGLFYDCPLTQTTISRILTHPAEGAGYSPFSGNTKMQNVTINVTIRNNPSFTYRFCVLTLRQKRDV